MGVVKDKKALVERFLKTDTAEFEVYGRKALFADPLISAGGEKTSYSVPTYEALKGITRSIYWKPTFIWFVDKVRVMNPIKTETHGMRLPRLLGKWKEQDLAHYTYLTDVRYKVSVHFEWNENRPEYAEDRNYVKHMTIFAASLLKGGRHPIFLGKSECAAYVEPTVFEEGEGAYDRTGDISMGIMSHSLTYPDEAYSEDTQGRLTQNYTSITMHDGIITFPKPSDCQIHRLIRECEMKDFSRKEVTSGTS